MNETIEQVTARATAEAEIAIPYNSELYVSISSKRKSYVQGVIAEATRDKWISSDQMMPNDDELVVCFHAPDLMIFTARVNRSFGPNEPEQHWVDYCGSCRDVTHWQPLPTPPSK